MNHDERLKHQAGLTFLLTGLLAILVAPILGRTDECIILAFSGALLAICGTFYAEEK